MDIDTAQALATLRRQNDLLVARIGHLERNMEVGPAKLDKLGLLRALQTGDTTEFPGEAWQRRGGVDRRLLDTLDADTFALLGSSVLVPEPTTGFDPGVYTNPFASNAILDWGVAPTGTLPTGWSGNVLCLTMRRNASGTQGAQLLIRFTGSGTGQIATRTFAAGAWNAWVVIV